MSNPTIAINFTDRSTRAIIISIRSSIAGFILLVLALSFLPALSPTAKPALAQGGSNGIISHTTQADFAAGCAVLTDVVASNFDGGEIRLIPLLVDHFDGTQLDAATWLSGSVNSGLGNLPVVAGGQVALDNSWMRSQAGYTQASFGVTARVQFGDPQTGWADFGVGKPGQVAGPPNLLFITNDTGSVFANSNHPDFGLFRNVVSGLNPAEFHDFYLLIDNWQTANYYVDGVLRRSDSFATPVFTQAAYIWLYTDIIGREIYVDWLRVDDYETTAGIYTSCVLDAGQVVNWSSLTWEADTPLSTSLSLRIRTSFDGLIWMPWSGPKTVSGSPVSNASGRYVQYMVELSTTNTAASPELRQVNIGYFGPSSLVVTPTAVALPPSGSQQFEAQVYDDNGDPVDGLTTAWQVVNGGGSIDSGGLFSAGQSYGSFTDTVRASSAGMTEFASVTIPNLPPVADAGGPYAGGEGELITLNGSAGDPNNDPLTFTWDLDEDGQYDDVAGATPSVVWAADGPYTINLRVSDSGGLSDTATATVIVANLPPLVETIAVTGSFQEGSPLTFTVVATDPGADAMTYAFDWTSDGLDDLPAQSNPTAVYTYPEPGLYTVSVTVEDDGADQTITVTTVSISNLSPLVMAGGPYTANEGQSTQLGGAASDPGGGPITYAWDLDADYLFDDATGAMPTVFWPDDGLFTLTLRVADSQALSATASATASIANLPPLIHSVAVSTSVQENQPLAVAISATDPGVDVLTYIIADNAPTMSSTSIYTYPEPGLYSMTIIVQDDDGGETLTTTLISVANLSPTASAGGPYVVDEGQSLSLNGSGSDPGGGDLTFVWDLDDDGLFDDANEPMPSISWPDDGRYTVTLRVADSQTLSATSSATVSVANLPPTATAGPDQTVIAGHPFTVTAIATDPSPLDMLTYHWDMNYDGQTFVPDMVGPSVTHIYSIGPTVYTVALQVQDDDGGLSQLDTTRITVLASSTPTSSLFLPLIFR